MWFKRSKAITLSPQWMCKQYWTRNPCNNIWTKLWGIGQPTHNYSGSCASTRSSCKFSTFWSQFSNSSFASASYLEHPSNLNLRLTNYRSCQRVTAVHLFCRSHSLSVRTRDAWHSGNSCSPNKWWSPTRIAARSKRSFKHRNLIRDARYPHGATRHFPETLISSSPRIYSVVVLTPLRVSLTSVALLSMRCDRQPSKHSWKKWKS